MRIETTILSNLIFNEEYARKTIPFLKSEYFSDKTEKVIFDEIDAYVKKYNTFPSKEALSIDLSIKDNLSEDQFNESKTYVEHLHYDADTQLEWLLDNTEKFCQDKAIYNAIMTSIGVINDKTGATAKGSIPQILSDALAVSFDTSIGHDFLDDYMPRYEFYHQKEERVPFDLEYLNKITKGGLPKKTLNIALAGTGVGKSLFMCHCAAGNLTRGLNVLYITMEMAEERIAERIDANLMNTPIDDLEIMPKDVYEKKIQKLTSKTDGKLIVKEYPTAGAGSANFRHLLNELKIKKNFKPDIIYIDYLNICSSSRIKMGASVNSYTYVKAIAEELRGLAVEFNVPIVSATQTTRTGYSSSDVDLTDTSESFGLPATADFMFALISTEQLQELNQIMIKQLKNRYNDPSMFKRFVVGVDRSRMKLYDVEQSGQDDLLDSGVMDKTEFGRRDSNEGFEEETKFISNFKKKLNTEQFKGFK
jgi:replicative DNA helicase